MAPAWRTRPVCIDGTVHDMRTERGWLRPHFVAPVEEGLDNRTQILVQIDLHAGIEIVDIGREPVRKLLGPKSQLCEIKRGHLFLSLLGDCHCGMQPGIPQRDHDSVALVPDLLMTDERKMHHQKALRTLREKTP